MTGLGYVSTAMAARGYLDIKGVNPGGTERDESGVSGVGRCPCHRSPRLLSGGS